MVYLAGDEFLKFNINGFDPVFGSLEFLLDPDWSKDVNCNSCLDRRSHTVFRFIGSSGYIMECIMTSEGIRVYIGDGVNTLTYVDNSGKSLFAGQQNHVGYVWDFSGESQSVAELYINTELSSSFFLSSVPGSFDISSVSSVFLIFGGKSWSGLTNKDVSGLNGVVESIRLYNYPKRTFYLDNQLADIKTRSRDSLELSKDGVSFYGYKDRESGLPLVYKNVSAGESIDFFVKPSVSAQTDPSRMAFIEVIKVEHSS